MTHSTDVPGRVYQARRDPERVQIEERAKALSEAGYPLPEDDPAMHAEQRLQEAKQTAQAAQARQVAEYVPAVLSPREVCQVLREVVFGRFTITNAGQQ